MAKAYRLDEVNALVRKELQKQFSYNISEAARDMGYEPRQLHTELTKERKQPKPGKLLGRVGLKKTVVVVKMTPEERGYWDCYYGTEHEEGKDRDYDAGYARRYAEEQQP